MAGGGGGGLTEVGSLEPLPLPAAAFLARRAALAALRSFSDATRHATSTLRSRTMVWASSGSQLNGQ